MAQHSGELIRSSAPSNAEAVVRIRGLSRTFGERTILQSIDLDIRRGEFVALLGRSGSGKSTVLRALAGLDYDVDGVGDIDVPEERSVIFQDARLLPWKRVRDNIVLGLDAKAEARADAALGEVGLTDRAGAWPFELSGGEQQRAALARSLLREPKLILADEPFSALDALTRIRMQHLLKDLIARHRPAVLLVTHDVDEAIKLADRIIVLDNGSLTKDIAVDLPAEAGAREVRVAALRSTLLAALGVKDDD
jgi:sulfonate transport system ATP-binding protein